MTQPGPLDLGIPRNAAAPGRAADRHSTTVDGLRGLVPSGAVPCTRTLGGGVSAPALSLGVVGPVPVTRALKGSGGSLTKGLQRPPPCVNPLFLRLWTGLFRFKPHQEGPVPNAPQAALVPQETKG